MKSTALRVLRFFGIMFKRLMLLLALLCMGVSVGWGLTDKTVQMWAAGITFIGGILVVLVFLGLWLWDSLKSAWENSAPPKDEHPRS